MPERPRKRFHVVSEEGKEGRVVGYERAGAQGEWVIKKLDRKFQDGISAAVAKRLRQRYTALRQEFGELIPNQKIMPRQNGDRYFIAQERLTLAEPADVFDYTPDMLPAAVQAELQQLVQTLRVGYAEFMEEDPDLPGPSDRPVLDLGPGNLLLTADGHVRFVDTNTLLTDYIGMFSQKAIVQEAECRIAQLDVLAGRAAAEVMTDPMYERAMLLAKHLNTAGWKRSHNDPVALKRVLDDVYLTSPLREYLRQDTMGQVE